MMHGHEHKAAAASGRSGRDGGRDAPRGRQHTARVVAADSQLGPSMLGADGAPDASLMSASGAAVMTPVQLEFVAPDGSRFPAAPQSLKELFQGCMHLSDNKPYTVTVYVNAIELAKRPSSSAAPLRGNAAAGVATAAAAPSLLPADSAAGFSYFSTTSSLAPAPAAPPAAGGRRSDRDLSDRLDRSDRSDRMPPRPPVKAQGQPQQQPQRRAPPPPSATTGSARGSGRALVAADSAVSLDVSNLSFLNSEMHEAPRKAQPAPVPKRTSNGGAFGAVAASSSGGGSRRRGGAAVPTLEPDTSRLTAGDFGNDGETQFSFLNSDIGMDDAPPRKAPASRRAGKATRGQYNDDDEDGDDNEAELEVEGAGANKGGWKSFLNDYYQKNKATRNISYSDAMKEAGPMWKAMNGEGGGGGIVDDVDNHMERGHHRGVSSRR